MNALISLRNLSDAINIFGNATPFVRNKCKMLEVYKIYFYKKWVLKNSVISTVTLTRINYYSSYTVVNTT